MEPLLFLRILMGKNRHSRRKKKCQELSDELSLYNGIRKKMPKPTVIHKDKWEKRKKRFDWRKEICDDDDSRID
jgi:hypothetical protein